MRLYSALLVSQLAQIEKDIVLLLTPIAENTYLVEHPDGRRYRAILCVFAMKCVCSFANFDADEEVASTLEA
jgi:uncharacterized hydantoinase/oxoprolinase family protein